MVRTADFVLVVTSMYYGQDGDGDCCCTATGARGRTHHTVSFVTLELEIQTKKLDTKSRNKLHVGSALSRL